MGLGQYKSGSCLYVIIMINILILSLSLVAADFKFDPSKWPSIDDSTDGVGYCQAPSSDASLTDIYKLSSSDSLNIALNSEQNVQNCPSDSDKFGSSGSCWWTCGSTPDGGKCLRPTDGAACNGPDTIGLSFDDGPLESTLDLLDYLVKNNLKATFFLVGSHMVQHPDIVVKLYQAGMELGVHTWSHHALTTQSNDVIISELGWTIKAFQEILGITPKLFRPPFGDIDDRVRSVAKSMGLRPVLWLADTNDWMIDDGNSNKIGQVVSIAEGLFKDSSAYPKGTVLLEHDYFQGGVDLAKNKFIPFFKSKGYTLKSAGQCMGLGTNDWFHKGKVQNYVPPNNSLKPKQSGNGGRNL